MIQWGTTLWKVNQIMACSHSRTHQRVVMKFGLEFKVFTMATWPTSPSPSLDPIVSLLCLLAPLAAHFPTSGLLCRLLPLTGAFFLPVVTHLALTSFRSLFQGHVLRECFPDPQAKILPITPISLTRFLFIAVIPIRQYAVLFAYRLSLLTGMEAPC